MLRMIAPACDAAPVRRDPPAGAVHPHRLISGETAPARSWSPRPAQGRTPIGEALRHRQLLRGVETLFESELFGHVRGAFTGATETKRALRVADNGILFLDESASCRSR